MMHRPELIAKTFVARLTASSRARAGLAALPGADPAGGAVTSPAFYSDTETLGRGQPRRRPGAQRRFRMVRQCHRGSDAGRAGKPALPVSGRSVGESWGSDQQRRIVLGAAALPAFLDRFDDPALIGAEHCRNILNFVSFRTQKPCGVPFGIAKRLAAFWDGVQKHPRHRVTQCGHVGSPNLMAMGCKGVSGPAQPVRPPVVVCWGIRTCSGPLARTTTPIHALGRLPEEATSPKRRNLAIRRKSVRCSSGCLASAVFLHQHRADFGPSAIIGWQGSRPAGAVRPFLARSAADAVNSIICVFGPENHPGNGVSQCSHGFVLRLMVMSDGRGVVRAVAGDAPVGSAQGQGRCRDSVVRVAAHSDFVATASHESTAPRRGMRSFGGAA